MGRTREVLARLHREAEMIEGSDVSQRPLIAVTTSELREGAGVTLTPQGEPSQLEMALGMKYLRAIELAGGIPVVIPPLQPGAIDALLSQVAGVCLSGGPDLDPEAYGAGRHDLLGPTWSDLDAFELAVARAADVRRLPILAICRGLQVLNVARGGTLHQHLPEIVGDGINHRQLEPGGQTTHAVRVEGSSRLGQVLGQTETDVNSFHHQSVDTLGDGLVVSARAPDGTVEGLEGLDREFVLGVQWHAECLVERSEHAALFSAFVEAARRSGEAHAQLARVA
ncbi:MAG: putative glutamine amidotransferase [Solirubrobacteraceae bacterium]|jgi:putative glutamine amidotransferase|nr:putative glutamine amidotransferase [Solirubrobacteraceae bacterium]